MKNRLVVIRAEQKLSQEDLSKLANVARATLSAIESEKTDPNAETIAKLVRALGVPANKIFPEFDVV